LGFELLVIGYYLLFGICDLEFTVFWKIAI
jgi:hypothetical protein